MTALAKRAVACKGWRWMPGMLAESIYDKSDGGWCEPARALTVNDEHDGTALHMFGDDADGWGNEFEEMASERDPDLDDPATLGCLLALVREAHNDPGLFVVSDRHDRGGERIWYLSTTGGAVCRQYYTREAEALVAALEAAP